MNTRTVMIGVVILVVGVALIAVGALGALQNTKIITTFSESHTGEYVSTELVLNTTSVVAVSSAAAVGGIIPAQDLNFANSTNISQYEISYSTSVGGTQTYRQLQGDYYYVAFSSSQPSTRIVVASSHSGALGFGALVLVGFVCIIAGIVVSVIGLRKKSNKNTELSMDEQYELSRRNRAPQ